MSTKGKSFAERFWAGIEERYGKVEQLFSYLTPNSKQYAVVLKTPEQWLEIIFGPPMLANPNIPSSSFVHLLDKAEMLERFELSKAVQR